MFISMFFIFSNDKHIQFQIITTHKRSYDKITKKYWIHTEIHPHSDTNNIVVLFQDSVHVWYVFMYRTGIFNMDKIWFQACTHGISVYKLKSNSVKSIHYKMSWDNWIRNKIYHFIKCMLQSGDGIFDCYSFILYMIILVKN